METKVCTRCGKVLPKSEFRTRKTKAGNLTTRGPCHECIRIIDRERYMADRKAALLHYSNGVLSCACCGEDVYEFLSIDHIHNDGAEHRRTMGNRHIEQWLRKHDYPDGFRVLCHNCNLAKGFYGRCPHQDQ